MAIQYITTAYIELSGKFSEYRTDHAIHDVVRVVKGTLEENLDLLAYRCADIFTLLTLDRVLHKNDIILNRLKNYPKMLTASLIVIYENNLYGVVIRDDQTMPQIVGIVSQVIVNSSENNQNTLLIDSICEESKLDNMLICHENLFFDFSKHILVTVPLGGHCFVQLNDLVDDDQTEQYRKLALLVGTSFVALESVPLEWIRFKDCHMTQIARTQIKFGQFIFMYTGSIVANEDNSGYIIYGIGPRTSTFNEAYYYSSMHCGNHFSVESKTKTYKASRRDATSSSIGDTIVNNN